MHKSSDLDSDEDFDTDADSNTDSDRKKSLHCNKNLFFFNFRYYINAILPYARSSCIYFG